MTLGSSPGWRARGGGNEFLLVDPLADGFHGQLVAVCAPVGFAASARFVVVKAAVFAQQPRLSVADGPTAVWQVEDLDVYPKVS